MSTDIRELTDLGDLEQLSALLGAVWGREMQSLDSDMLRALEHSGSYVCAAYVRDRMVGGLVGWLGGDPRHELHMHSHILGVLPGDETRGIGFELKQHQRRWCLERDVRLMEWTTDPLVRRNVYFNLTKLGAEAPRYLVNFYAAMDDGLNAGEESDRLLIRWRLDSDLVEAASTGQPREPDADRLREWGSNALVAVGPGDEPVARESSARVVLCQIPEDIVAMRRSDPALARRWRSAIRLAIGGALDRGYAITGATRSGWYVLESTST